MRLTISIPAEIKGQVAKAAKSENRSISNYAARVLAEHLSKVFAAQKPQKRAT